MEQSIETPETKPDKRKTVNLKLSVWQRLHETYARLNVGSLSNTVEVLLNENAQLKQRLAQLEA